MICRAPQTLGNICSIEKLTAAVHARGVPLVVDNTVPTPYLWRQIDQGADIVIYSLTKYIGGHGTTIGVVIVDSGKFPGDKHAERFPVLNQPDPSYHGVVYTEALGAAAFHRQIQSGAAAQHRRGSVAAQRVSAHVGPGDTAVARTS